MKFQLLLLLHFSAFCFFPNIFDFYFRDFSTSKMIGAKGLLGRSWPDLDMLPLGWLTDPGYNLRQIAIYFHALIDPILSLQGDDKID